MGLRIEHGDGNIIMTHAVAHNAAWNVAGQVITIGVALAAVPMLLHELGAARLGVFTLALGLIGFSGLFDLGMGRALTQMVSGLIGQGKSSVHVSRLVWKIVAMLAWLGLLWMLALWMAAPLIVHEAFSLDGKLADEALFGLRALALSTPFVLAAVGAVGALEGLQEFRLLSLWRMPMSILQFGLPVAMALVVPDVGWVIAALAVTRLIWMILWLTHLQRLLPHVSSDAVDRNDLRHALRFGGWLSISSLAGPILVYADRFYLASLFPPAAVSHYTVPFDAAYRATSLPQTAVNAMFPALSHAQSNPAESSRMVDAAIKFVLMMALPVTLTAAALAGSLLRIWLGVEFSSAAEDVLALLALGVLFNSFAHVPYALVQAHGRADLTAKIHLIELPLFVLAVVLGVHAFGITGAALAWTVRVGLDAFLLFWAAWWQHRNHRAALARGAAWMFAASLLFLLVVYGMSGSAQLSLLGVVVVACLTVLMRNVRNALRKPDRT